MTLVRLFILEYGEDRTDYSWKEAERWMRHGDEEGSWGRKAIALLSYDAVQHLRRCIEKGVLLLDTDADTFDKVCKEVTLLMGEQFQPDEIKTSTVLKTLKKKIETSDFPATSHKLSVGSLKKKGPSLFGRRPSMFTTSHSPTVVHPLPTSSPSPKPAGRRQSITAALMGSAMRKVRMSIDATAAEPKHGLPIDTELTQIFAGVVPELLKVRFALVRLRKAVIVPELSADMAPLRFLVVVLGPKDVLIDYHEVGRSMAVLMSNPYFYSLVRAAKGAEELLASVDAFLNDSLVVPPGEVDDSRPLHNADVIGGMRRRMRENVMRDNAPNSSSALHRVTSRVHDMMTEPLNAQQSHAASQMHSQKQRRDPLAASGRLFGGMIEDVRERLPFYWSDLRDALNGQCIASVVFLFIASIANALTFGTMMNEKTGGVMGVTEMLLGQCVVGVIAALFCAQPLLILSASGPVVLFEYSMMAVSKEWYPESAASHFFVMHLWASIFIFVLCVGLAMCDGAVLLGYITPFTEDVFTLIISFAFLKEIAYFVKDTYKYNPVQDITDYAEQFAGCLRRVGEEAQSLIECRNEHYSLVPLHDEYRNRIANATRDESRLLMKCEYYQQPDTFVLSMLLLLGTFYLAWSIRRMKDSVLLGRKARQIVGNSCIVIALLIMSLVSRAFFNDTHLQKVTIPPPHDLRLATNRGMSLFVLPHMFDVDAWTLPLSALWASLILPLLFTEMQVAQVLLRAKERALQKGNGGHNWDLVIVGFTCLVCGVLGLPWMCAAVVHTVEHCESLSVVRHKHANAPPMVVRVYEQRVTALIVALLTGACIFAADIINQISYAELYGVLLYLAAVNIHGIVYISRAWLLVTPHKFWPDMPYCTVVPALRMHLYTLVQTVCLIGVSLIKYFPETSIVFPATIVVLSLVRQYILPCLFGHHLHALDAHGDHHGELTLEKYFDMVNDNI